MPISPRTSSWLACAAVVALLTACSDGSTDADAGTEASPQTSPQVVVEELSEGQQRKAVDVDVDGPVQVNHRKITLPPGTGTGKHCHHGQLVGVVETGTLTHYAPTYPDGVHAYTAGDSLVEGAGYVHEGRNEGDEDVVLWVTYLTPTGEPLAETDLAACDSD